MIEYVIIAGKTSVSKLIKKNFFFSIIKCVPCLVLKIWRTKFKANVNTERWVPSNTLVLVALKYHALDKIYSVEMMLSNTEGDWDNLQQNTYNIKTSIKPDFSTWFKMPKLEQQVAEGSL